MAFVYLIVEEPHPDEDTKAWVKIGYSQNPPEWRLNANLKRGNSRDLCVKAAFEYATNEEARAAEKLAHEHFKGLGHKGNKEWFQVEWQEVERWFTELGAKKRNPNT
jgi:T5orf172 domain